MKELLHIDVVLWGSSKKSEMGCTIGGALVPQNSIFTLKLSLEFTFRTYIGSECLDFVFQIIKERKNTTLNISYTIATITTTTLKIYSFLLLFSSKRNDIYNIKIVMSNLASYNKKA
jgi:hypothetical protein